MSNGDFCVYGEPTMLFVGAFRPKITLSVLEHPADPGHKGHWCWSGRQGRLLLVGMTLPGRWQQQLQVTSWWLQAAPSCRCPWSHGPSVQRRNPDGMAQLRLDQGYPEGGDVCIRTWALWPGSPCFHCPSVAEGLEGRTLAVEARAGWTRPGLVSGH